MSTLLTPAISVFLVMADTCFEGSDPVVAFLREDDAAKFAELCNAYAQTRPKPPSTIEDTPWNDAQWDAYDRSQNFWRINHPAGEEFSSRDSFSVKALSGPEKTRTGSD